MVLTFLRAKHPRLLGSRGKFFFPEHARRGTSFSQHHKPRRHHTLYATAAFGKYALTLASFFFLPLLSGAQLYFTTSDFLALVTQSQPLLLHERQLDFLKNTDHELPWADQLEFRTETDEMDLNRQEYLLRFRYHTKAERRAQRNLHQSEIQWQELEKKEILEEILMDQYFLLVQYISLDREITIIKQQQAVAIDKLTVLRRKFAAVAEVDLNDLLNAEHKIHELDLKLMEMEGELQQIKNMMANSFGTSENIFLDTSNILTINEIKSKIPLLLEAPLARPEMDRRQLAVLKTNLEYEKEKAENTWQVDYVQFKHAGRDNLNYVREWSFGMGIEIPLKGAGKLQKNEILLDRIELENRLKMQELSLAEQLEKIKQELDLKIRQYDLVNQQLANSQLQYSADNYPLLRDADPLVLLNIKSNMLLRQSDQMVIEKGIYQLYLELVELSGKAIATPLRNYLTKDWEPFSQN